MIPFILWFSFCLIIATAYVLLMGFVWDQCRTKHSDDPPKGFSPTTKISVVICARNEENNIAACLKSIVSSNYPSSLFEVIVIDDHSSDDTSGVVKQFSSVRLYPLQEDTRSQVSKNYKKQGIQYGVSKSNGQLIACTDADCIVSKDWLLNIAYAYENDKAKFIAGPVLIKAFNNPFSRFEALDFLGMMGLTEAGIRSGKWHMANGANMAFDKDIYLQLDVYDPNYASGDDINTIQSFAKKGANISFIDLPSHLVQTIGNRTLSGFVKQRLRWATKNKAVPLGPYFFMMSIGFLLCLLLIINFILCFIFPALLPLLVFLVFVKLAVDFVYLHTITEQYLQSSLLKQYAWSSLLHIIYIFGIGLASLFVVKYDWKGRRVK